MRFSSFLLVGLLAACNSPPGGGADAGEPVADDAGEVRGEDASPPGGEDAGPPGGEDAGPDGAEDAGTAGGLCPPGAPYGQEPGDVAEDVALVDCDGVEHSLHELCDREAVWLFEYADWCPPCRGFAADDANRIYDRFESPSFGAWMIVSEDSGFGAPDAADCSEIRDRYGIHMPVLYDPEGRFQSAFGVPSNEVHVVLRRGAVIDWVGHYAGGEVESRIEAVVSGP